MRELKKKDEIELKNCDTKSDEAGLQREREKLERENPIRDFFARERMRKRERERERERENRESDLMECYLK